MSEPTDPARTVTDYPLYINGAQVRPVGARTRVLVDPHDGSPWATVIEAEPEQVDAAVAAAREALDGAWGATSPGARARHLNRLADAVERHAARFAQLDVLETGRPLRGARERIAAIAGWYRYFGGLADKLQGHTVPMERPSLFAFTVREPLGVIGVITPGNGTLLVLAFTLAPALAAGNTVVVKPSETGSPSAVEFARCIEEAGLPAGVFNVVTGEGATTGAALTQHPDVARVAFTGSHATGVSVAKSVAEHCGTAMLELSGKSPNIIFDDAPLEAALSGVADGVFTFTGQMCVAGSRALVQQSIYEEVVEHLAAAAQRISIGNPLDEGTGIGPMATAAQARRVLDYVRIGQDEGARLVTGGGQPTAEHLRRGNYVEPTVFADVQNTMRLAREEIFGPVLALIPFQDEAEAIAIANDSLYGLGAGVWTTDVGRALRVARAVKAGTVYVNMYLGLSYQMPFGGYKQSGVGRENGMESILDYTQTKSVWVETTPIARQSFDLRLP